MINCELGNKDIYTGCLFEDIILLVAGNNCKITPKSHLKTAGVIGVAWNWV
jgi:hypothetical protein